MDAASLKRFPLSLFAASRAGAPRIARDVPTRRTSCDLVPLQIRPRAETDMLRMLLLGPREEEILSLAAAVGLRPGDARRTVQLALDVAIQHLRLPIALGSVLARSDGRGVPQTVVGVKPEGFMEDWQTALARDEAVRRGPGAVRRRGLDEPLVWTVDPTSAAPGISQSRLSDWVAAAA